MFLGGEIYVDKSKHCTYKLDDFIGKDEKFIKSSTTEKNLVQYNTLINNMKLLEKVLSILKTYQIDCFDYDSALFLEQNLNYEIELSLIDDYQNKDRSYIDLTLFKKHKLFIPISYYMWNVNFKDSCNINCMRLIESSGMQYYNGDKLLYRKTLEQLKKIVNHINMNMLSDLDKCIVVSNYLQSKVEYICKISKKCTEEKLGSIITVINYSYGLCIAIANATTLLLNNPIMNVNVRTVCGLTHSWNLVNICDKNYYLDVTWAITANRNHINNKLKSSCFNNAYLLFGIKTADKICYHNNQCYIDGKIEEDDYPKDEIEKHIKTLKKSYSFNNYSLGLKTDVLKD